MTKSIFSLFSILLLSHTCYAYSDTDIKYETNEQITMVNDSLLEKETYKHKIEDIQQRVQYITSLSKEELKNNTNELAATLNTIQSFSSSLPKGSTVRKADVYFASVNLKNSTFSLMDYLSDKDEINYELAATDIYANIILRFFNTNYALVGDSMIRSALIHEKVKDFDTSKKIYSALLKDFIIVLEYLEPSTTRVDEDNEMFFALSSLETAAERLIALNHLTDNNASAIPVLERIEKWRQYQSKL